jgi:hypothetical protein
MEDRLATGVKALIASDRAEPQPRGSVFLSDGTAPKNPLHSSSHSLARSESKNTYQRRRLLPIHLPKIALSW